MKKRIFLIFFIFLILNIPSFAQQLTWLLEPQTTWQPTGNSLAFMNKKGETALFNVPKRTFVQENTESTPPPPFQEQNWADDIPQKQENKNVLPNVYDRVVPLGTLGFQVEKYGMKAVVSAQNRLILPYSNDYTKIEVFTDNFIRVTSRACFYFYELVLS
jgi:hypothetical protein